MHYLYLFLGGTGRNRGFKDIGGQTEVNGTGPTVASQREGMGNCFVKTRGICSQPRGFCDRLGGWRP